jgi:chemotaxis protein histidine kinase CheA/ActR/RegA family two-component response regulator
VTGSGGASLARFRANLQTRIKTLRSLFETLEYLSTDAEAIRQVRGELHTFKGEARLLGLFALSELTHGLEELVDESGATDFSTIGMAIDAMHAALSGDASAGEVEARVRQVANELLGLDIAQPESSTDTPTVAVQPEAEAPPVARLAQTRWVQIDASLVDALCEQMSDLASSFGRLQSDLAADREEASTTVAARLAACRELLDGAVDRTWNLRLAPIEPLLRQLEQHAKTLAMRTHKELEVRVTAASVGLERDVVDQVWDSLLHLVQNSVAHGLESPEQRAPKPRRCLLELAAVSSGAGVSLTVRDDGAGIDPNAVRRAALTRGVISELEAETLSDEQVVQLVFRPGFSTTDDINELSGRGIGLDVVKAKIERLGGSIELQSQRGVGTKAVLTVPHTITKERVLVVQVDDMLHGIPCRLVRAVLGERELPPSGAADATVRYGDEVIPVRSFSAALGSGRKADEPVALVLQLGSRLFAVSVTRIVAEQDLLRRPSGSLLSGALGVGASGSLDDGRLVLLLDFAYLERILAQPHRETNAPRPRVATGARRGRVLVVDDSPVVTSLVSEILTGAGLAVEVLNNSKQAMQAIARQEPDLVLSDVEMPEMNGFELLDAIRVQHQSLPVVMLTTRGSVEDRQRASSLGANAYVLKSAFSNDVLLDVIGRFVDLRP